MFGGAAASAQSTTFRAIGVDTSRAKIPLEEIFSGGPLPQGIPALGFGDDHNGAAGWTPCGGPILASILALAGSSGSASQGSLLLNSYAFGFGIPFLLFAQLLPWWQSLRRFAGVPGRVGGVLLIVVGTVLLLN